MSKSTPNTPSTCRGFTLTELLIVITILAILSGLALSALSGAQEEARVQRTRAIISKLDQLIMEKWDGYLTRSVQIDASTMSSLRQNQNAPRLYATARLNALRELMRMEMPDGHNDIEENPAVLAARPALSRGYMRRLSAFPGYTDEHEEAECLYLIISTMRDGDKSAIEFFSSDEIGDTDNDGLKEFLDAWGTPIRFLRWAPGYRSDATNPAVTSQNSSSVANPDPFDPLKVDITAPRQTFALRPLIYSYGPNKLGGVRLRDNFSYLSTYSASSPWYNDPYYNAFASDDSALGSIRNGATEDAADNITNHFLPAQ